jgi:hypothetical protein
MVKPGPFNHLQMSLIYMTIQALVSALIISTYTLETDWQWAMSIVILLVLGSSYIAIKAAYKRKYAFV